MPVSRLAADQGTATQLVHSLNMREPLSAGACDALLPVAFNAEDRSLAHIYHEWPSTPALHLRTAPLQAAAIATASASASAMATAKRW